MRLKLPHARLVRIKPHLMLVLAIHQCVLRRLAPGQEPLALRNNVTLCPKDGVRLFVHKRG